MRNAQKMHNKIGQPVTGEECRNGYEALNMTEARMKELGIEGMLAPFSLSCAQHEGFSIPYPDPNPNP